jgi:hypothetical protein
MANQHNASHSSAARCPFAARQLLGSPPPSPCKELGIDWGPELQQRVAAADPLRADALLPELPRWNARAETSKIIAGIQGLLRSASDTARYGLVESLAAMRDLGMLFASLRRHGLQPVEAVPTCEPVLLALGRRTGMIPRDTVFHYTVWNPSGARERSFTGDPQEAALIASIRLALPRLDRAIRTLTELAAAPALDEEFLERSLRVETELRGLVEAIEYARSRVDAVFFAQVLRPYFEPITVGGAPYLGSAAAHIPLWLVDHLLWASDRSGEDLQALTEDAAKHALPMWTLIYVRHAASPSVLTRVLRLVAEGGPLSDAIGHSVYRSMRTVLQFRGKHRVLAEQAYRPGIRRHSTGSGGYSVVSLDGLLKTTLQAANEIRHALARH